MYFHTDDKSLIGYLADVFKTAEETGTRIRLNVNSDGSLIIKRGEGIWSPPFASTPDPYRDSPKPQGMKWFLNEDGYAYQYPAEYQREAYPNDFHQVFDTPEAANEWADANL
jgi:hypothetical protein